MFGQYLRFLAYSKACFLTAGVSNSIEPGAKSQNLFNAAGRKDDKWLNVHELEQAMKQHQVFDV